MTGKQGRAPDAPGRRGARSLANTSLGLLAARLSQPAISVILFATLARLLSLEDYGLYILVMGVLAIFQSVASLGLGALVTRELAAGRGTTGEWLGASLMTLVPPSMILWLGFPLFCVLMGYPHKAMTGAWVLGVSLPFSALLQAAEGVFIVHGVTRPIVVQSVTENVFRVVVSLVCVLTGHGVLSLFVVFVAGRVLALALVLRPLRGLPGALPLRFDMAKARYILSRVRAFLPLIVVATVAMRVDLLVLSYFAGETAIGSYGPAARLLYMAFLLPDSFNAALFPRISSSLAQSREQARELVAASQTMMIGLLTVSGLILVTLAPEIVRILFGPKFSDTAGYFQVLILMLPWYFMTCVTGYLLQAGREENTALAASSLSLVVIFVCNVVGARWMGPMGTALATCSSCAAGCFIHYRLTGARLMRLGTGWHLVRASLCLVAVGGFIALEDGGLTRRLLSCAAGLCLCVACGVVRPKGLWQVAGLVVDAVRRREN